jgi:hypothetical protein
MLKPVRMMNAGLCLAVVFLLTAANAPAHGIVGNRLFIEPLVTEDANPKNELDFPILEAISDPNGHSVDFNYSLEKLLRPRVSVDFENSYSWFRPAVPGAIRLSGWGNIGLGVKYALYKSPPHEFIMSAKFGVELPTGNTAVGANDFTTLEPEFLYAKGFGDLPSRGAWNWLRPFAVQGDVTLDCPAGGPRPNPVRRFTPRADLVLEYSIPYLNEFGRHANRNYSLADGFVRKGHSVSAIAGDLFPFTEFNFQAAPLGATGRRTYGFFRPGVVYVGHYFEIGGAVKLPANSFTGTHLGGIGIFDLFIDDVFPAVNRMLP